MKVIGNRKLESSPKIELDEAVFLRGEFYIYTKTSKSNEPKDEAAQSHKKYNLRDFKKCSEEERNQMWS